MGLKAKDTPQFPPVPEGVHHAICIAIYDVGHQFSEKWNKTSHQVVIVWEFPEVRIEIEKDGTKQDLPRLISKTYTLSLNDRAALRKDLQAWRGKNFTQAELDGFELEDLLRVNAMIGVIHKKKDNKTFANLSSIAPLYKAIKRLEPESKVVFFSMDDGHEIPKETPKWIRELIENSTEYSGDWGKEGESDHQAPY